jgi:hypothetical protein
LKKKSNCLWTVFVLLVVHQTQHPWFLFLAQQKLLVLLVIWYIEIFWKKRTGVTGLTIAWC